jgi:hypothetical protein
MKQISASEIVNLAHQAITQKVKDQAFFSSQHICDNLHQVDDDTNFESADKLLVAFYNATHATLESYQSLFEVQKKINEDNKIIEEMQKDLSNLESASKAYIDSDSEFMLSLLQQRGVDFDTDQYFIEQNQEYLTHQKNLKNIKDLKASLEEKTNSEEYQQNLKRIKEFESEIKKAEEALTKILSVDFGEKKAKDIKDLVIGAGMFFGFCLVLAGLAALSYFVPAGIAGIMAFIVGIIPCLLTILGGALAAATGAFFLAPIVWEFLGVATLSLGLFTYEGVYIAAPYFGHVFAAMSAICLVTAIICGIHALLLKRTNDEDFIKQNIQPKIEEHINLFQKNSTPQIEKTNEEDLVDAPCNLKIA